MRTRALCCHGSGVGSPGSRATSVCTCQVLRPRRAVRALALTCPYVLPSAFATGVGAQDMNLYEAQWLAYALPYRRFAAALTDCDARLGADMDRSPSSYRTCTDCSLPVSQRTAKDSVPHPCTSSKLRRSGERRKYRLNFDTALRYDCCVAATDYGPSCPRSCGGEEG